MNKIKAWIFRKLFREFIEKDVDQHVRVIVDYTTWTCSKKGLRWYKTTDRAWVQIDKGRKPDEYDHWETLK